MSLSILMLLAIVVAKVSSNLIGMLHCKVYICLASESICSKNILPIVKSSILLFYNLILLAFLNDQKIYRSPVDVYLGLLIFSAELTITCPCNRILCIKLDPVSPE